MNKHGGKDYIGNLCKMEFDPMIDVYKEELSYLDGMSNYTDVESQCIISTSIVPSISIEQIREILHNLEVKFNIESEIVEYEYNHIEFKSPLINAWVELYLRTNPKERGK